MCIRDRIRTAANLINTKVVQENLHESRHKIRSLIRQDFLRKTKMAENVGKCLSHILGSMLFQQDRLRIICAQIKDGQDESVPMSLQTGGSQMISMAIWQNGSETRGKLCNSAGGLGAPLPRRWQTSQLRQNSLTSLLVLGQ